MKANPHAWFYAHLRTLDGWGLGHDDTIKESIISSYSGGKTASVRELYEKYPAQYRLMHAELTRPTVNAPDLDKARKRVIAVVFAHLKAQGYTRGIDYVKQVACNAAGIQDFNSIPLQTLKSLYRSFGEKQGNTI